MKKLWTALIKDRYGRRGAWVTQTLGWIVLFILIAIKLMDVQLKGFKEEEAQALLNPETGQISNLISAAQVNHEGVTFYFDNLEACVAEFSELQKDSAEQYLEYLNRGDVQ